MTDDSLALLKDFPECAPVLEAYRTREAEVAQRSPAPAALSPAPTPPPVAEASAAEGATTEATDGESGDDNSLVGWVDRVQEVVGIERSALSGIHGRLIAFGLLKCEVGHRSAGLVYRVSTQGKAALKSFLATQMAPLAESA